MSTINDASNTDYPPVKNKIMAWGKSIASLGITVAEKHVLSRFGSIARFILYYWSRKIAQNNSSIQPAKRKWWQ